jgi:Protein of unknown function (DUF4231)
VTIFHRGLPDVLQADGTPREICDAFIAWLREKADRNERTTRLLTALIAAATAAIPVFLVLSTRWLAFFLGKVVPAVLAALAALITALLHVWRSNDRWRLYRTYERTLETERLKYANKLEPYHGTNRDSEFLKTLAQLHLSLHDKWAGLVPKSTDAAEEARAQLGPG